jgi:hypothetical protein
MQSVCENNINNTKNTAEYLAVSNILLIHTSPDQYLKRVIAWHEAKNV